MKKLKRPDQIKRKQPRTEPALRTQIRRLEQLQAEHARAEKVQAALYRIADAASAVRDMQKFYVEMHRIVG